VRISLVPKEAMGHVWKDVEGILDKAVDTIKDKSKVIDILIGIYEGIYVLWVVLDDEDKIVAAFTTRLIAYPRRKALAVDWVGGTQMKEWEDQWVDTMKRYANELDCSHIEGYGRKGWGRELKKY
tara:strand:- start:928 stop:1302 length:375 start_codon:yes stop_codon:yes gene_type:complete